MSDIQSPCCYSKQNSEELRKTKEINPDIAYKLNEGKVSVPG